MHRTTASPDRRPPNGWCGSPRETSWERPVPYTKALLEPEDTTATAAGSYPFCKIAGGSKRWDYIFGLAHYALHQEVNYCGNGFVTHIAWARTCDSSGTTGARVATRIGVTRPLQTATTWRRTRVTHYDVVTVQARSVRLGHARALGSAG